jgi:hypothetical protein
MEISLDIIDSFLSEIFDSAIPADPRTPLKRIYKKARKEQGQMRRSSFTHTQSLIERTKSVSMCSMFALLWAVK